MVWFTIAWYSMWLAFCRLLGARGLGALPSWEGTAGGIWKGGGGGVCAGGDTPAGVLRPGVGMLGRVVGSEAGLGMAGKAGID